MPGGLLHSAKQGSTLRRFGEQMLSRALQERDTSARRNAEFRAELAISLSICAENFLAFPPPTLTGPGLGSLYRH